MKGRTTLLLAAAFLALLAVVLFIDRKETGGTDAAEGKLADVVAENVEEITFKNASGKVILARTGSDDWTIREPLETPADPVEVSSLLYALSDLRIERTVEAENGDPQKYGIPAAEIGLKMKGSDPAVTILLGAENPVGGTFYARKDGDPRIVLLPSSLKSSLSKTFFDFRRKDVFRFDTGDVTRIEVSSGDIRWTARKDGEEWFLESPVAALAKETEISSLLDGLAGLRAAEFSVENKKAGDPAQAGLDRAEATVRLGFPSPRKDLIFAFQSVGGKTLATNSDSPLIVVPVVDPTADLKRTADAYRETRIAPFNSWEVAGLAVKSGGVNLDLARSDDGVWTFLAGGKGEADREKVNAFLQKIERIEADGFIDRPDPPSRYGLDKPRAEVTIRTKSPGEAATEKSVTLLVGAPDRDGKTVARNTRFDYLYKIDGTWLDDLPQKTADWMAIPSESEKGKTASVKIDQNVKK